MDQQAIPDLQVVAVSPGPPPTPGQLPVSGKGQSFLHWVKNLWGQKHSDLGQISSLKLGAERRDLNKALYLSLTPGPGAQAGGARPRQKTSMLSGQPGLQETSSQNPTKSKTQTQRNHSHPQGPEGGHASPKDVSNKLKPGTGYSPFTEKPGTLEISASVNNSVFTN